MMNMSRRYNDKVPTIYAVRGNTATGKTYNDRGTRGIRDNPKLPV